MKKKKAGRTNKNMAKQHRVKPSWIRRIGVLLLSLAVLATFDSNILDAFKVLAEEESNLECVVMSFLPLPEEVATQTVCAGTPLEELQLPDTLEAVCTYEDDNKEFPDGSSQTPGKPEEGSTETGKPEEGGITSEEPGESMPPSEEPDEDDGQMPVNPGDDGQPPEEPGENGQTPEKPDESGQMPGQPDMDENGQTPGNSDESGQTPETPDEGGQTPGKPEDGGQMSGKPDEDVQTPEKPDTGDNMPGEPDAGGSGGNSAGDGENEAGSAEVSGAQGGTDTGGTDNSAGNVTDGNTQGQTDSTEQDVEEENSSHTLTFAAKISNMFLAVKEKLFSFSSDVVIEETQVSIDPNMAKPEGESSVEELTNTVNINPVTWECITEYDSGIPGGYIFVPLLPGGFVLDESATLPEIMVTVEDEEDALIPALTKAVYALVPPATSGECGNGLTWQYANGTLKISGSGAMGDYDKTSAPWAYYTDEIKKIEIGSGVKSIGNYAFYGCSQLGSLDIPGTVTSIGEHALDSCSSLGSVSIPSGVASIGNYAFHSCAALGTVSMPDSVTSVGGNLFEGCSALLSVTISGGLQRISEFMFSGCSSLQSVTIPGSVTSIGNLAFRGCSSLGTVEIPGSVKEATGYAFKDCPNTILYYPASLTDLEAARSTKASVSYVVNGGNTELEITWIGAGVDTLHFPAEIGNGTVYSANWGDYHPQVHIEHDSFPDHNYIGGTCAICGSETVPSISIDYVKELLVGFEKGKTYRVGTKSYPADAAGEDSVQIAEEWFGTTVSIVRQNTGQGEGKAQELPIKARPQAPTKVTSETVNAADRRGGRLLNVDGTMEYQKDGEGSDWHKIDGTTVENLEPGVYYVRIAAVEGTSFCSLPVETEIEEYALTAEDIPQAVIDYRNEKLINLAPGGDYQIGIKDTGISAVSVKADASGAINIKDPDWFGKTVSIVKIGNGTTIKDSDSQSLFIKPRPSAPTGVGTEDATEAGNDGKLINVNNKMEYRKAGDASWTGAPLSGTVVEGLAPGEYEIRRKATDSSFASEAATRFIASANRKPEQITAKIGIDFVDEALTGLKAGDKYLIDGTEVTAEAGGRIKLQERWIGKTVSIVKAGDQVTTLDSEEYLLSIPARPDAPVGIGVQNVSAKGKNDGKLTNVNPTMEYQKEGESGWKDVKGSTVNGLSPGIYMVCYKATANSFCSRGVEVVIKSPESEFEPEKKPTAKIDYLEETLTGLAAGTYEVSYGSAGAGSDTIEVEANQGIPIEPEWFGADLNIVKLGNGFDTENSQAQLLPIKNRPDAPKGVTPVDESKRNAKDGKLQGVNNAMQYRREGDSGWKDIRGKTVSKLSPGIYFVRYKPVKDKEFCSDSVSCTIRAYARELEPTPSADISYDDECFIYLIPGAFYKINGTKVQADERGEIPLRAAWMKGKPVSIVQLGDGITTDESPKQSIIVPKRPAAPKSVKAVSESGKDKKDGKLTGVNSRMEYRLSGGDWFPVSGDTVEDLEPGTYEIRYVSADGAFVSAAVKKTVYAYGKEPKDEDDDSGEDSSPQEQEPTSDDDSTSAEDQEASTQTGKPTGNGTDGTTLQSGQGTDAPSDKTLPDQNVETDVKEQPLRGEKNSQDKGQDKNTGNDGKDATEGRDGKRTVNLSMGQGKVSVTVQNIDETSCRANIADAAAVADAVLTGQEAAQVRQGESAEILISIERIDGSVSQQEKELAKQGIEAYADEISDLKVGMYVDISVYTRFGDSEWKAVEETNVPIEIIIDIPEDIAGYSDEFYAIRVHGSEYWLLGDMDDAKGTITIRTHLFSTYAIVYRHGGAEVYTERAADRMEKFYGFAQRLLDSGDLVWIAVILAEPIIFLLLLIYFQNKKKRDKECQAEN